MSFFKFFFISFFLSLSYLSFGQNQDTIALQFAEKISIDILKKHISFLASDSSNGRATGSIEQQKVAHYIARTFKKAGLLPVVKQLDSLSFFQSFVVQGSSVANVLGYLEGTTKKEELIVVTAHYDHLGVSGGEIYNGADDNGTGTSTVMTLAEIFSTAKKMGYSPQRSILFMTVTGEEMGLLGSDFYSENPIFPLEKTMTNINIDMIGRTDSDHTETEDYIYVIGSNKLSQKLHMSIQEVNNQYSNLNLDDRFNYNDPEGYYYRSDHYNFAKHKIPSVFFFAGVHEDYHQPTDDIEKIQFSKLQKRAKLIFHTLWKLAFQDQKIEVDLDKR